ncbi:MAG: DUF3127 domain-containing protein [Prevotella sp.]|nr:DUF3127 domain-containing protein [Prevotella sp.]
MEIEGKVIAVLPEQGGVSPRTGNAWKSQEYVIETHDQYPRKCCFRVFGADRISNMNIQVGEELRVSFDVDAREYQGRWYNTLSAWRVDRVDPTATQAAAMGAQPMAAPGAFPPPPAGFAPATPTATPAAQENPFPPVQQQEGENSADDLPF